jgi:hypothetical protein
VGLAARGDGPTGGRGRETAGESLRLSVRFMGTKEGDTGVGASSTGVQWSDRGL